jgi:hypothetical protein
LAQAELIVGPWAIAKLDGTVSDQVVQAVLNSSASKLLIPTRSELWEWVGVDRWDTQALVQQTVRAIQQTVAGEQVKLVRPLGAGTIISIVIGVLFVLGILTSIGLSLFNL